MHVAAEPHETSLSSGSDRLGLGTTDQLLPFHDSMRVLTVPPEMV